MTPPGEWVTAEIRYADFLETSEGKLKSFQTKPLLPHTMRSVRNSVSSGGVVLVCWVCTDNDDDMIMITLARYYVG